MRQDLQHALRAIRRMPLVTAIVVASLAVGIGVNTAVFSWVQAVILKPLPGVADPGGFHFVEPRGDNGTHPGISWLEYLDLQPRLTKLQGLIAFRMVAFSAGDRGRVERAYGMFVSGNYFQALGLTPA